MAQDFPSSRKTIHRDEAEENTKKNRELNTIYPDSILIEIE